MTTIIAPRQAGVAPARRSASEWRALLRTYSRSNETRKQFCTRHGVALSTFDRWRQRLRQDAPTRAAARSSVPATTSALFVELAPDKQPVSAEFPAWDMELELGHGVFLRLRRGAC
jgi:transposase-like protein